MRHAWPLTSVVLGSVLAVAQPLGAAADLPTRFPAAGEALRPLVVRAKPDPAANVVRRLRRFRADHQFQIVLALQSRRGEDGSWWYLLSLPGRPNGARGWVRADTVEVRPVRNRIVVRLGSRRIEVRRLDDGAALLRAPIAIGRAGAETPVGHDFYVQSGVRPDRWFLRCIRARDERLVPAH